MPPPATPLVLPEIVQFSMIEVSASVATMATPPPTSVCAMLFAMVESIERHLGVGKALDAAPALPGRIPRDGGAADGQDAKIQDASAVGAAIAGDRGLLHLQAGTGSSLKMPPPSNWPVFPETMQLFTVIVELASMPPPESTAVIAGDSGGGNCHGIAVEVLKIPPRSPAELPGGFVWRGRPGWNWSDRDRAPAGVGDAASVFGGVVPGSGEVIERRRAGSIIKAAAVAVVGHIVGKGEPARGELAVIGDPPPDFRLVGGVGHAAEPGDGGRGNRDVARRDVDAAAGDAGLVPEKAGVLDRRPPRRL